MTDPLIDGYRREDRWEPEDRPYAIRRYSAAGDALKGWTVEALWPVWAVDHWAVGIGHLHLQREGLRLDTFDLALGNADTSTGGVRHVVWDGFALMFEEGWYPLASPAVKELGQFLDGVLTVMPALPPGWDGWYYRATQPREEHP